MTNDKLTWSVDADGVAVLTLNNPGQLNAMDMSMARDLEHLLLNEARDDAVGALVVTGAGRAFCSGANLSGDSETFVFDENLRPRVADFRAAYDKPPYEGVRDYGGRMALAIHALPKPVIAAINGPAVGFGATFTLAMDIRLASTTARIGYQTTCCPPLPAWPGPS